MTPYTLPAQAELPPIHEFNVLAKNPFKKEVTVLAFNKADAKERFLSINPDYLIVSITRTGCAEQGECPCGRKAV